MSHIFISYSRKDFDFVQKIVDALAVNNLDTWIDWKSIPKGEDWEQEIYRGIEEADAFLFLISPNSVASQMCNKEIEHAVKNGKRILPIFIRDAALKSIHPEISKRNWIFCRDGQDDFKKAIEETRKTIHTDYEWLKYHTELQVKALKWEQKKDASRLLRGKELREVEENLAESQKEPQPTDLQRLFILASQQNEGRQRRRVTFSLAIGLLIMLGIAIVAILQWQRAENQANISLARQLVAQSQLITDPSVSVIDQSPNVFNTQALLAIESEQRLKSIESYILLDRVLSTFPQQISSIQNNQAVTAVAISTNGQLAASGYQDGIVKAWDTKTGKILSSFSHDYPIMAVMFTKDNQLIVSIDKQTIKIWNIADNVEVFHEYFNGSVYSITFSPDNTLVAVGGVDPDNNEGLIVVWDIVTRQKISQMNLDWRVYSIDFNPDGDRIISGSGSSAQIWEVTSGRELARVEYLGGEIIVAVAFDADGKTVASLSHFGNLWIWNADTGQVFHRISGFLSGLEPTMTFSPDGKFIMSGSGTGEVHVIEVDTGKKTLNIDYKYEDGITQINFSPKGDYLLFVGTRLGGAPDKTPLTSPNSRIYIWDLNSGKERSRIQFDYSAISSVSFDSTGNYIISGDYNGTSAIWNLNPNQELSYGQHDYVVASDFSADGKLITLGGLDDHIVDIFDVNTGRKVASIELSDAVFVAVFAVDNKLLTGSFDGTVRIWDIDTAEEILRMQHDNGVITAEITSDGKLIASGSFDDTARIWDVSNGQEISRMQHDDVVRDVAFSPDGKQIISGSDDGTARVWETKTGNEVFRIQHDSQVLVVAYSSNGKWVASGGEDGTIKVYEAVNGTEVALFQHDGNVNSIAFSPDNSLLVSGSSDKTIRVWSIKRGVEISQMPHEDSVDFVTFSGDSEWVVSGSSDKTVRVWETMTGQEVARRQYNSSIQTIALSTDQKMILSGRSDGSASIWIWEPNYMIAEICKRIPSNMNLEDWYRYFGEEQYHITCPNIPLPDDIRMYLLNTHQKRIQIVAGFSGLSVLLTLVLFLIRRKRKLRAT